MKVQHSLKVSLHGMNSRMQAMMASYLELNCNGIAYVVDEIEADAEIVDVDLADSKNILEERLSQQTSKPIIAISLYDLSSNAIIYVKKPIKVDQLVTAIDKAKNGFIGSGNENSENSIPELAVLLNENGSTKKIKTKKEKEKSSVIDQSKNKSSPVFANQAIVKSENNLVSSEDNLAKPQLTKLPFTGKETEVRRDTKDIVSINSSRPRPEIDKFLQEFDHSINKKDSKEKGGSSSLGNNRRNTVRYVFQAVTGCLKKKSLLGGLNTSLPVIVEAISSKGALIKVEKALKLSRKVTLEIQLDSQYIFTIPAKVIRQNSKTTYGLAFLDYQHKLTEYLIGSGRSFNIK